MKYNNAGANKEYRKVQEMNINTYRELGMSEEAIREICKFDREVFKSNRRFREHNIYLDDKPELFEDEDSPLTEDYPDELMVIDTYFEGTRDCIYNFSDERLCEGIDKLSEGEWNLLWSHVGCEYMQKEIAEEMGITRSAMCQRMLKIKEKF